MTDTSIARQTVKGSPMPEHPPWCDKTTCTVATSNSGHHLSRAVNLAPIAPNPLAVAVQLMQGMPVDGFPLSSVPIVTIAFDDDEGELFTAVLYVATARRLGRLLTHYPAVVGGSAGMRKKI